MAKFKITPTTTVAELKEQFSNEVGGVLRIYEGRSEAADGATLVSLGAKEGELECRTNRTVGKFEEAFQNELNLKVKVYTKDNWVKVLDGITLASAAELPNGMTKAKMEEYLSYKREEKEETAADYLYGEDCKNSNKEKCPSDLSYKFEDIDDEALDLSNWDTADVTDMHFVFCDCTCLEEINMNGWNTSNVTTMWGMFSGCNSLTDCLGLSSFDTKNVCNMSDMFLNCSSIQHLDLSHFDVSKVKTFSAMFAKCSELNTLDLSGWEIAPTANTDKMFKGCKNLAKINVNGCNSVTVHKLQEALSEADIDTVTIISDLVCSKDNVPSDYEDFTEEVFEEAKSSEDIVVLMKKSSSTNIDELHEEVDGGDPASIVTRIGDDFKYLGDIWTDKDDFEDKEINFEELYLIYDFVNELEDVNFDDLSDGIYLPESSYSYYSGDEYPTDDNDACFVIAEALTGEDTGHVWGGVDFYPDKIFVCDGKIIARR